MPHHNLLIIGTGSGNSLITPELEGLDIAIVEEGRFGGTCLNVGCIPTKMYVLPADRIVEARESDRLGVTFPNRRSTGRPSGTASSAASTPSRAAARPIAAARTSSPCMPRPPVSSVTAPSRCRPAGRSAPTGSSSPLDHGPTVSPSTACASRTEPRAAHQRHHHAAGHPAEADGHRRRRLRGVRVRPRLQRTGRRGDPDPAQRNGSQQRKRPRSRSATQPSPVSATTFGCRQGERRAPHRGRHVAAGGHRASGARNHRRRRRPVGDGAGPQW